MLYFIYVNYIFNPYNRQLLKFEMLKSPVERPKMIF